MKVVNLKTNHIVNPLGFDLEIARVSYQIIEANSSVQTFARIEVATDELFKEVVFDTKKSSLINHIGYNIPIQLNHQTKYFWRVTVWGDKHEMITSDTAWFETAKQDQPWLAKWISRDSKSLFTPVFNKTFQLQNKPIV